jgi:heme exporter protein A
VSVSHTARRPDTGAALPDAAGSPLIVARALGKRYAERLVLTRLELELEPTAFLMVTGPNGSGKTTLLRLLAGLTAPSEGELRISLPRERIGYLAHDPLVYRELTARENLLLFERLYGVREERSQALLGRFGLTAVADQRVSSYSQGMRQRLALCRTLLHEPALLLLDEPFASLDEEGAALLESELASGRDERAVVVATHEPERLRPLATGFLELG